MHGTSPCCQINSLKHSWRLLISAVGQYDMWLDFTTPGQSPLLTTLLCRAQLHKSQAGEAHVADMPAAFDYTAALSRALPPSGPCKLYIPSASTMKLWTTLARGSCMQALLPVA